ncbi:MAG TPA: YciI family protein [Gemmatimonadaceae bacterium]|nr:YciI family protein [Gemmatimonadaceae bacterium]
MQYILLNYVPEDGWNRLTKAQQDEGMAAAYAYNEALTKAGIFLGSNRLQPSASATTVRTADGKTQVLDGPYADTREQLGGYYMIDVPDLDAALAWAARCPGSEYGVVEVRAIWPRGGK